MKELHIETKKTARVIVNGKLDESTKEIVIVLHGYAQLADYFIKKFDRIKTNERTIIAPEGLSRFYWQGMNGRVVASWMTKVDRENEIKDQIQYLNQVYKLLTEKVPNAKVTILGFSQGTATVSRWIGNTKLKINRIILWAGGISEDVLHIQNIKSQLFEIIIGDKDEYISNVSIDEMREKYDESNINYNLTTFKGGHDINSEVLLSLFS